MRALIIDDESSIRSLLTRFLTRRGWEVAAVANSKDAVASVEGQEFNIAIIDVDLGGEDGLSLARALLELRPQLRLIFMSGDAGNAARIQAAQFGPFLKKPFDLEQLNALLPGK